VAIVAAQRHYGVCTVYVVVQTTRRSSIGTEAFYRLEQLADFARAADSMGIFRGFSL
jgi:hypothetical protein